MTQEELIQKIKTIDGRATAIEQPLESRVYISCEAENGYEISRFLFEDVGARFVIATAIDCEDSFEIIYHFSYDQTGCAINQKTFIRDHENPQIESITPLIPGAEWIEREIHDLYGIHFKNHPRLERLILADDWPEGVYPLRKETKS